MSTITANMQAVNQRIASAQQSAGRIPGSVRLLAVSKTFSADAVVEAIDAGQFFFGENYVQEALEKMARVHQMRPEKKIHWAFIGPIQSNKTRLIAEHFDSVQSLDRGKIAERLSEQRPAHLPDLDVLVQVNISDEASKSGVQPENVKPLVESMMHLPHLNFRGLMAVPAPIQNSVIGEQGRSFAALHELAEQLTHAGLPCPELSMGMSGDLEAAIREGATIVRVGTALFGNRPSPQPFP